jgi:hypothetical protein
MTDTADPNDGQDRAAMTGVSEPISDGLHYFVLPKDGDPVAALNILREAAGLKPWPSDRPGGDRAQIRPPHGSQK